MADIEDIQNGEVGSSVKDKLNDTIAEANKLRDLSAKTLVGNKSSDAADATNDIELKEVVELATATHENVPTTKAVHDLFGSIEIPDVGTDLTLVDDDNFVNSRSDTASSSQAIKAYVDAQEHVIDIFTHPDISANKYSSKHIPFTFWKSTGTQQFTSVNSGTITYPAGIYRISMTGRFWENDNDVGDYYRIRPNINGKICSEFNTNGLYGDDRRFVFDTTIVESAPWTCSLYSKLNLDRSNITLQARDLKIIVEKISSSI